MARPRDCFDLWCRPTTYGRKGRPLRRVSALHSSTQRTMVLPPCRWTVIRSSTQSQIDVAGHSVSHDARSRDSPRIGVAYELEAAHHRTVCAHSRWWRSSGSSSSASRAAHAYARCSSIQKAMPSGGVRMRRAITSPVICRLSPRSISTRWAEYGTASRRPLGSGWRSARTTRPSGSTSSSWTGSYASCSPTSRERAASTRRP